MGNMFPKFQRRNLTGGPSGTGSQSARIEFYNSR